MTWDKKAQSVWSGEKNAPDIQCPAARSRQRPPPPRELDQREDPRPNSAGYEVQGRDELPKIWYRFPCDASLLWMGLISRKAKLPREEASCIRLFGLNGRGNRIRVSIQRKTKKQSKPRKNPKSSALLEQAVGKDIYRMWVSMLKKLVPYGRTHRLAVVVAGMLQYASMQGQRAEPLRDLFVEADEDGEEGSASPQALRLVQGLFKDAGVKWNRKSSRGQSYSVADEAVREYIAWDNYPWE